MKVQGVRAFEFIVLFLIFNVSIATQSLKHKARKDYKFKAEYVTEEVLTASHMQCLAYCSVHQDCISASFKSPLENCLLSNHDTTNDNWESPSVPIVLEFATGWNTMTLMKFQVFHALGNYQRYTMTFQQAQQQCIDYGTSIATPSDLLDARSLGYEYCICAWLSDETMGFVLQASAPWCTSTFHTGIILCYQATADVFCKLK